MWYNLVRDSDGRLEGNSSKPLAGDLRPGFVVVETETRTGVWDEATRSYIPVPLHRVVSLADFIRRFERQEQEDLIDAAKTIKKAATFVEVMKLIGSADLDSDFIIDSVNSMESAGVLGAGRAAVILNG